MSHQEILEQAIKKARKRGWRISQEVYPPHMSSAGLAKACLLLGTEATLLFDHGFAKALWGEPRKMTAEDMKNIGYTRSYAEGGLGAGVIDMKHPGWQRHLQQMVIAPDPITYLGDNIG